MYILVGFVIFAPLYCAYLLGKKFATSTSKANHITSAKDKLAVSSKNYIREAYEDINHEKEHVESLRLVFRAHKDLAQTTGTADVAHRVAVLAAKNEAIDNFNKFASNCSDACALSGLERHPTDIIGEVPVGCSKNKNGRDSNVPRIDKNSSPSPAGCYIHSSEARCKLLTESRLFARLGIMTLDQINVDEERGYTVDAFKKTYHAMNHFNALQQYYRIYRNFKLVDMNADNLTQDAFCAVMDDAAHQYDILSDTCNEFCELARLERHPKDILAGRIPFGCSNTPNAGWPSAGANEAGCFNHSDVCAWLDEKKIWDSLGLSDSQLP